MNTSVLDLSLSKADPLLSVAPRVRCRQIRADDLTEVIDVLTSEFKPPRSYWVNGLAKLTNHPTPDGFPKYGYILVDYGQVPSGKIVGVLLLISTSVTIDGVTHNRSNVSSWCVEAAYRSYAPFLSMAATARKDTTYFNTTPAPHTWGILERQGFRRFCEGRIVSFPSLCRSRVKTKVKPVLDVPVVKMPQAEIDLLMYHRHFGCISLVCEANGEQHPFVFSPQLRRKVLPIAHLIYCRNIAEYVRFAGPIGRYLLREYGIVIALLDANAPVPGLVGKYFGNRPRFRKGAHSVDLLGNVAYSEQVLLGY